MSTYLHIGQWRDFKSFLRSAYWIWLEKKMAVCPDLELVRMKWIKAVFWAESFCVLHRTCASLSLAKIVKVWLEYFNKAYILSNWSVEQIPLWIRVPITLISLGCTWALNAAAIFDKNSGLYGWKFLYFSTCRRGALKCIDSLFSSRSVLRRFKVWDVCNVFWTSTTIM